MVQKPLISMELKLSSSDEGATCEKKEFK